MAKTWNSDEDALVDRMRGEGATYAEIGVALGRSSDSVRSRCKSRPVVVPNQERHAFASAAADAVVNQVSAELNAEKAKTMRLERQLASLGMNMNLTGERLDVQTDCEPPPTPEEQWRDCEEDSARRIKDYRDKIRFSIDFEATDPGLPIGVSFISDQHISPGNLIDFRRMREDAELVAETPGLYACLGGDGVDNHIVIPSATLAARSQPQEQWQLYNWYLGIFAHKIMAMISGNHDAWTDKKAGVDMVHWLAQRNRICYSPFEARMTATVGGHPYKIAFRHRYRFSSSLNITHAVKRWWDMGEEDFDVGVICHEHEPEVNSFHRHGLERWAGRPGAYQVGSSFVREFGWNQTAPTCPTFILYPGTREMTGFNDVRKAARFLKSERGNR